MGPGQIWLFLLCPGCLHMLHDCTVSFFLDFLDVFRICEPTDMLVFNARECLDVETGGNGARRASAIVMDRSDGATSLPIFT